MGVILLRVLYGYMGDIWCYMVLYDLYGVTRLGAIYGVTMNCYMNCYIVLYGVTLNCYMVLYDVI
jgi:hypothetical protein